MEVDRPYYQHPSAIVEATAIGPNTRIWAFVHILPDVKIGRNCNICDHCYVESGVSLGDNVTVKSGIYIWKGVTIEDDVFLGPNVVFTNDVRPRSKQYLEPVTTLLRKGCSIGANSTVLAGVTIGAYSMAGIGAVITRDVPDHALVYGNPARWKGWVDEGGNKLVKIGNQKWQSPDGSIYLENDNRLHRL